jgi:hypothetical protein
MSAADTAAGDQPALPRLEASRLLGPYSCCFCCLHTQHTVCAIHTIILEERVLEFSICSCRRKFLLQPDDEAEFGISLVISRKGV